MEKRKTDTRWGKIAWIVACCALGVLVVKVGVEVWLGSKIRRTIVSKVSEASDGAYRAEVGGVRVGLFNRAVRVENFTLHSDSARLRLKGSPLAGLNVRVAQLSLGGIRWDRKGASMRISADELEIISPRIVRSRSPGAEADTSAGSRRSWRDRLDSTGILAEIGRFDIRNARVEVCDYRNGRRVCHRIEGLSLGSDDLCFDMSADSLSRPWFCSDMELAVDRLDYRIDEGAVLLEVDTLRFGAGDGSLYVAAVRLEPQYPKDMFARRAPGHIDWTRVSVRSIGCTGIDWAAWTDGGGLRIDSLSIPQAEVESYKNRQVPRPQRVKQLFYRSLQRLPFAVDVRRITLGNVRARYDELSENGTEPGIVQFDSLSGEFYGLTNRGGADDFFRLEARGKLYGAGLLKASFRFPSDSLNRRFEIDGSLGPMSLPLLNRVVTPLAGIQIDSGRLERIEFRVTGNDARSEVQMTMLYDGLDVEMVKRQPDGRLKERRLMTFVVDKMLIRPSNPDGRGTRTADGSAERDPYRSQFNYWWKSLLPGIKNTVLGKDSYR